MRLFPLDIVQMCVTSGLFVANIIISGLIHRKELEARLKYIGQEMTFLALGLIVARLSSPRASDYLPALIICIVGFLLAWLLMMAMSEAIVEHGKTWRNPLVYLSILLGVIFVYLALTALPLTWVHRGLSLMEMKG